MIKFKKNLNLKYLINFFENHSFYISALFLSWALPVAGIFLLISIIISLSKDFKKTKIDKLYFLFFFLVIIMLFSCIINYVNFDIEIINSNWDKTIINNINKSQIWLNILNWFPMFLIFLSSKKYLDEPNKKIKFAFYLTIGNIPVILSCILQYWFKIYGPFNFLYGTIVWFQKPPLIFGDTGVAGLFSNQNYAGSWLVSIIPFSIYFLLKNNNFFNKFIFFFNSLLISYFTILTNSRNALIGLIFSMSVIFGLKGLLISLVIGFILSFIFLIMYMINSLIFWEFINTIRSNPILSKLSNLEMQNFMEFPRLEIYSSSLNLISQKPIWGYGSGTFPAIYELEGGLYNAQHTHNLPLQIAYDFGIPTAFIICFIVSYLFIKSIHIVFFLLKRKSLIDVMWILTFSVGLIFNITDITIYDGKINILFWILLAGLNSIVNKNILNKVN